MPALIYNPLHFLHFHESAHLSAPGVAAGFAAVFPEARDFVDVGAGSGAYAAELTRRGKNVVACEHSPFGRFLARRQRVDIRPFDLNSQPPAVFGETFDLAYCFEVAEHLPEPLGLQLAVFVASLAPTVVFTAAQPGQGGTGHINEKPKGYWEKTFAEYGFSLDSVRTDALASQWMAARIPARWLIDNVLVFTQTSAK